MVERLLPATEQRTVEIGQPWTIMLRKEAERRRQALGEFQERMRAYENGRRQERRIGELVLVRNFARKKGEPRWKGPYPITKLGAQSLMLRTDAGRDLVVNKSDVKAYRNPLRAAVVESVSVDGAEGNINIQTPRSFPGSTVRDIGGTPPDGAGVGNLAGGDHTGGPHSDGAGRGAEAHI
jgi:hypothetical protein